ncbi:hypothetical protein HKK60_17070 [Stenotrophomonas maltophilia]|uniref:hypothetical protein n=1 Tax=Stenotrophomonas maltophilia TaxID=40324 RepID=UPI0014642685|nr:hypothetical protein [Stenotrophomonas maltophilia]QJP21179.1 hypothetical protein HKK60_17070 [Stenotrophomonas maltophilia]
MGLLLILPLLVSGYIFCNRSPLIRYRLPQYDGQLLYFFVAYQGIVCFTSALVCVTVVSAIFSHDWGGLFCEADSCLCPSWFTTDYLDGGGRALAAINASWSGKGQLYTFFLLVSALTMLMPFIRSRYGLYKYKKAKESEVGGVVGETAISVFLLKEALAHLPLTQALFSASVDSAPILVLTDDRRVYVGLVSTVGTPTEATSVDEDFGLWPLMSGYCDKDSLEMVLDADYPDFDRKSSPQIFMRQKDVVSVTPLSAGLDIPFPHRRNAKSKSKSKTSKAPFAWLALGYFAPQIVRVAARVVR